MVRCVMVRCVIVRCAVQVSERRYFPGLRAMVSYCTYKYVCTYIVYTFYMCMYVVLYMYVCVCMIVYKLS